MKKIFYILLTLIMTITLNVASSADLKEIEEKLSDSVITAKLTAKFAKDTQLNPFKIYVSTKDGDVSIKGHVKDTQAYVEAMRLAKTTKGVKSVNMSQLEIKPVNTAFTDAYITTKVLTALLKTKIVDDPTIPLVSISATTTNGEVTLTGNVKRLESIEMIKKNVESIRGVQRVNCLLKVDATLN